MWYVLTKDHTVSPGYFTYPLHVLHPRTKEATLPLLFSRTLTGTHCGTVTCGRAGGRVCSRGCVAGRCLALEARRR